ncbi:MAG: hypothetical protein ACRD8U_23445, partial [Pyrinomonadaceae bacterium]
NTSTKTFVEERINMKQNRKFRPIAAAILALACASVAATAVAQQGPPTNEDLTFQIDDLCAFPVLVEIKGKTKTLELPGGRTLFTFPGEDATFTNLDDPSRQETLGITGSIEENLLANGDLELVFRGRNLIIGLDPVNSFVVTIGRFSLVFDQDFNITQPLSGNGQVINICELLE